jgi:hypothetical protein
MVTTLGIPLIFLRNPWKNANPSDEKWPTRCSASAPEQHCLTREQLLEGRSTMARKKRYDYMGVSINGDTPIAGWFIMEKPMKIDHMEVPTFQETSIYTIYYSKL